MSVSAPKAENGRQETLFSKDQKNSTGRSSCLDLLIIRKSR